MIYIYIQRDNRGLLEGYQGYEGYYPSNTGLSDILLSQIMHLQIGLSG